LSIGAKLTDISRTGDVIFVLGHFLDAKLQLTEYYQTNSVNNTFSMLPLVQDSFTRWQH